MTTYHSRPATVEAWLYDGSREARNDLLERLAHQGRADVTENHVALMVLTNNGWVEVKPNHYLIQGVADFYPCDPQTFEARWSTEPQTKTAIRVWELAPGKFAWVIDQQPLAGNSFASAPYDSAEKAEASARAHHPDLSVKAGRPNAIVVLDEFLLGRERMEAARNGN